MTQWWCMYGMAAWLTAEYVSGDNFRLFSSLKIPVGAGLSGWVCAITINRS